MFNEPYSRIYFLDASALVKLVICEPGSESVRALVDREHSLYSTLICFAEGLGVLKRLRFAKKPQVTQEVYIFATNNLRAQFSSRIIRFADTSLLEPAVFFQAADLSDRHHLDLSDTLQIVSVQQSHVVGATLVTADRALAAAARAEGLEAWDCVHEPVPSSTLGA